MKAITEVQSLLNLFKEYKIVEKEYKECLVKFYEDDLAIAVDSYVLDRSLRVKFKSEIKSKKRENLPVQKLVFECSSHRINILLLKLFKAEKRLEETLEARLNEKGLKIRSKENYKILSAKDRKVLKHR